MKKIILLLLPMILLIGCNIKQKEVKTPQTAMPTSNDINSLVKDSYIIQDVAYHEGKLILLYAANDNTKIASSKIVIVDSNNYTELAQIDDNNIYTHAQIMTTDNGFYINNGSDIKKYDYQLNIVKNIQIDSLSIEFSRQANGPVMAISDDFSQLAYVNSKNRTLIVKNLETGNTKKLYSLSDLVGSIMDFDQIYFCDDYIAFAGKYIYAKDFEIAGSNVYGRINIQSLKMDFHEKNETTTKFIDNHMLIIDLMRVDDNDTGTGEAIIYDIKNNAYQNVKLDHSYNSFNLDFPSADMVISYSDVGRNTASFILYRNGKSKIMDEIIPKNILDAGSCYNPEKQLIIVFYILPNGDDIKSEIRGVELI